MAREIRLDFVIDSEQIKEAARALDQLEASAKKAETAFDKLNAGAKDIDSKKIKEISDQSDRATKSIKATEKSIEGLESKLSDLAGTMGKFHAPSGAVVSNMSSMAGGVARVAGALGPIGLGLASVGLGMAAFAKVTQLTFTAVRLLGEHLGEFNKQMEQVSTSLPKVAKQGREAVEVVTALTGALAGVSGVEFDEALKGMSSILGTFGGSAKDAAAELGALSQILSAKQFGDAIDWFEEYDVQFQKIGLSAIEMRNIMINSVGEGVFNDKAFDALKSFGVKVNNLTAEQKKTIASAGLSEVVSQINKGSISAAEGLGKIGARMRELKSAGKDLTPVTTALFEATGEDMGDFIMNIDRMLKLTPELEARFNGLKEAVKANLEANALLNNEYNKLSTQILPSIKGFNNEASTSWATFKTAVLQIVGAFSSHFLPIIDRIREQMAGFRKGLASNSESVQTWSKLIAVLVVGLAKLVLWMTETVVAFGKWATGAEKSSTSAKIFAKSMLTLVVVLGLVGAFFVDVIRLAWNLVEALWYLISFQWDTLAKHVVKSMTGIAKAMFGVLDMTKSIVNQDFKLNFEMGDVDLLKNKVGGLGAQLDATGESANKAKKEILELLKVEEEIQKQKLSALQAQIEVERAMLESAGKYRLQGVVENALAEVQVSKELNAQKYKAEVDALNETYKLKLGYNAKVLKLDASELDAIVSSKEKAYAYERDLLNKQAKLQAKLDATTDKDEQDKIKAQNKALEAHLAKFSEVVQDKTELTKQLQTTEVNYFSDVYDLRQKELALIMEMKIAEAKLRLERAESAIQHMNSIKGLRDQVDALQNKPQSGIEPEKQALIGLEAQTRAVNENYKEQLDALKERVKAGELTEKAYLDRIKELNNAYEDSITDITRKAEETRYGITIKYLDARKSLMQKQASDLANLSGPIMGPLGTVIGKFKDLNLADKELDKLKKLGEAAKKAAEEMLALGQITQEQFDEIINKIDADSVIIEIERIANGLKRFEAIALGVFSVMSNITNAMISNIEAEINAQKRKIDALKEQNKLEADRNNIILQRQAVENILAEQRIKELETLKTTIPESEKKRADEHIALERKRIQSVEEMKKRQDQAAANRVLAEQRRLEQLEKKKLQMQSRAFEIQKAADLTSAAINTAVAVIKTYAQLGFPFGIPAAAAVGMLGAAQIAAIASQQNPYKAYEKGTLWVEGPKLGKDSVPAILAPGEAVIPYETNKMYGTAIKAIYNREISPKQLNNFINGTGDNTDVVAAILSKPTASINLDEDGFNVYLENVHTKTRIRNRKLRL